MDRAVADQGLAFLGITLDHTERLVALPFHHRDPFDRLLVAQALAEEIPLVSADPVFDAYGVARIWR
jgi:PIN domain nuclease of toxin-antitoxin system